MQGVAGGRITASAGQNLIGQHAHDRNQEATCYVGNLDPQVSSITTKWPHAQPGLCSSLHGRSSSSTAAAPAAARHCRCRQPGLCMPHAHAGLYVCAAQQVTEELVWELFIQAGPVGASAAAHGKYPPGAAGTLSWQEAAAACSNVCSPQTTAPAFPGMLLLCMCPR